MLKFLSRKPEASTGLVLHLLQICCARLQPCGAGCCQRCTQKNSSAQDLLLRAEANMLDSSSRAPELPASHSCSLPRSKHSSEVPSRRAESDTLTAWLTPDLQHSRSTRALALPAGSLPTLGAGVLAAGASSSSSLSDEELPLLLLELELSAALIVTGALLCPPLLTAVAACAGFPGPGCFCPALAGAAAGALGCCLFKPTVLFAAEGSAALPAGALGL